MFLNAEGAETAERTEKRRFRLARRVWSTRRGKPVARLVPVERATARGLPDLSEFRASIKVKGKPLSWTVIDMRNEERY